MCKAARSAKARKSICDEQNKETIKRESVRDVTTPWAFHKLLIIPPLTQKKSISFDNEAASTSLKGQVARSSRRSVAPVQWSLSVLCQKSENTERRSNHLHHSM